MITREQLLKSGILSNYVLVRLARSNDEIDLGNRLKLYLDGSYDEGRHATIVGEVVIVPKKLTYGKTAKQDIASLDWKTSMEVLPGDKVWFNFIETAKLLNPENNNNGNVFIYEKDVYVLVKYSNLFAAKRLLGNSENEKYRNYENVVMDSDGSVHRVIMLNGYVLIEPETEEVKTNKIILPEHLRKKKSGKIGYVRFAGSCNEAYYSVRPNYVMETDGDYDEFKIGDRVLISHRACDIYLENQMHACFNGKNMYYRVQRKFILYKFHNK
jgi:hypothetical protein